MRAYSVQATALAVSLYAMLLFTVRSAVKAYEVGCSPAIQCSPTTTTTTLCSRYVFALSVIFFFILFFILRCAFMRHESLSSIFDATRNFNVLLLKII